jgi:hypothetical protein
MPHTKLCGDNYQIVLLGISKFTARIQQEIHLEEQQFSCRHGVLNKDPTVWLEGAIPPPPKMWFQ